MVSALSGVESLSLEVVEVISAEFVITVPAVVPVTVAFIIKYVLLPLAKLFTVQILVSLLYDPCPAKELAYVVSDDMVSVTFMFVAVSGPSLLNMSV